MGDILARIFRAVFPEIFMSLNIKIYDPTRPKTKNKYIVYYVMPLVITRTLMEVHKNFLAEFTKVDVILDVHSTYA